MSGGRATTYGRHGPPSLPGLAIGLVDGNPLSTFGLRRLLRSHADRVCVVDGLADAELVLVDPHLPMADITDVADLLDTMSADGVVVYTWATVSGLSGPESLQAAGWPLLGWLSKGLPAEDLVSALEQISDGAWVILDAPSTGQRLRPVPDLGSGMAGLTPRENQIISLVAAGFTNRQIADRSYLSINSVKTYIRSAYRKMGVTRRAQAVLWALQHEHVAWPPRSTAMDEQT